MSFGIANVAGSAVLVKDERYVPLSQWGEARGVDALLADWDTVQSRLEQWAADGAAWDRAEDFTAARAQMPYRPAQIFCTGANYKKHVVGLIMGDPSMRTAEHEAMPEAERQEKIEAMMEERAQALPFCFIKLPSCAIGPHDTVLLPPNVEKPDWELELGVVIGRRAHRVSAADAMDHVAGYAVVNDVTAREHIFRRDGSAIGPDWLSGKCFPTFLPFGPMIVPRQHVPDPYALTIRLSVNGRVFQNESTGDMMASIEQQIEFLSHRVILEPGDLICTGSPYGNGSAFGTYLKPGDVMEGTITGLGTQRNPCEAAA